MKRRDFIRATGGGVIMAASAGLVGCSQSMPAGAIEAWKGPGPEADVRRWILGYAILAQHSHNLQSWLVDLATAGEVLLRCDLNRLLPETDPFSRQIMMSHGTFLELLDIATRERGLRATITLFPEGAFGPEKLDQRPVARVRLGSDPAIQKDSLFAQILRRHTNRSLYDLNRPVPPDAWKAMADAVMPNPLRFRFVGTDQPHDLKQQRAIAGEAWRIELTTSRTIMESYKLLRVGPAEMNSIVTAFTFWTRWSCCCDLMNSVSVAYGRMGVIYSVVLRVVRQFALKEEYFRSKWDDVKKWITGTPGFPQRCGQPPPTRAALDRYAWRRHCRGLFHTPMAA